MSKNNGDYRDLERAIETGLKGTYGGNHRVVVRKFKQEHDGNPFCQTYPVELVVYSKNASLTGDLAPQQDLFAPINHSDNVEPLVLVKANGQLAAEPWDQAVADD